MDSTEKWRIGPGLHGVHSIASYYSELEIGEHTIILMFCLVEKLIMIFIIEIISIIELICQIENAYSYMCLIYEIEDTQLIMMTLYCKVEVDKSLKNKLLKICSNGSCL